MTTFSEMHRESIDKLSLLLINSMARFVLRNRWHPRSSSVLCEKMPSRFKQLEGTTPFLGTTLIQSSHPLTGFRRRNWRTKRRMDSLLNT